MSGECDKCGEHALECNCLSSTSDISKEVMAKLECDLLHEKFPFMIENIFYPQIVWFCKICQSEKFSKIKKNKL